ncbi:probable (S)-N-methylcoclaurine 3'-hydroxylase isozyme 2, partial [Tanacetum coccineum]
MCPGEAMAPKTILISVASLIGNFDWFLPNNMNPNEINMDEEFDMSMHMKESLHMMHKFH